MASNAEALTAIVGTEELAVDEGKAKTAHTRPCVSSYREHPNVRPAETVEAARAKQRSEGFSRYAGPRLAGPRHEIEYGQEGYPDALMSVANPPKRLYVIGNADALQDGIAIVGARMATPYGLACAHSFAGQAAAAGISVVSGGARGCDAQAHRGALDAGGRTVVVLGGGCDEIYPAEHFALFQDAIDHGGAVVSEQPWEFPPLRHTFRARNRIIAGMARATLIVEAGLPSGTFSTADDALAAGRDVLAVPGAITSKTSRGCNHLILQGATPIVDDASFADVLFSLFGCLKQETVRSDEGRGTEPDESTEDRRTARELVFEALRACPSTVEGLLDQARAGALPVEGVQLHRELIALQRAGLIVQYVDGRYGPIRVR